MNPIDEHKCNNKNNTKITEVISIFYFPFPHMMFLSYNSEDKIRDDE